MPSFQPILALALLTTSTFAADGRVDFNRDVRPILSENCFACHGPDKGQRKADLRLDQKDGLFAKRDGEPVVVPSKPEASAIVARISSKDADVRMPPAEFGKRLTAEQIETIRRWIAQGAEWKGHWAYIRPQRVEPPTVAIAAFVRNDIDRFTVEKMREHGLAPSQAADRVTLIRRLYFDLIGLPPKPAEVEAFVNDKSDQAYAKLIERLLKSPHFGERMATYWLDVVRYADTNGIHGDNHRDVWLYRDYVIRAFNENKRFDRFTIEQIAGDLLPDRTHSQWIASGYNRLLMTTREGGAQAKEYLAKYSADRVRNTATAWLGATLGCAECHDHKFDPYTQKDFYSFAAFFADLKETAVGQQPQTPFPTDDQQKQLAELDRRIAELEKQIATPTSALAAAQKRWEASSDGRTPTWKILKPTTAKSSGGAQLKVQPDGSILVTGPKPDKDVYTITVSAKHTGVTAIRLEVLPDKSLPAKGPGRAQNGNFVLNELELSADGKRIGWGPITATHSQKGYPVQHAGDGNSGTGWAILNKLGQPLHAVFETKVDVAGETLTCTLRFNYGTAHTIGKLRLASTTQPRPVRAGKSGLPAEIARILAVPAAKRNKSQRDKLAAHYRSIAPELAGERKQLADANRRKASIGKSHPTTLVSLRMEPRMIRVLPRGNWLDDSGEIMQPDVPGFLPNLTDSVTPKAARPSRLELAKWMVTSQNPLTARVFVNRLWKLYFGRGIVATADDFGAQGAWPTHPELLDWLAVEFIKSGWDVKHMIRLIVGSGTYRQSSASNARLRAADPYNRWLARQSRFRLDAEMVRDNALAVSGLLVEKIGGPSVKPYQPSGYWKHLNFPRRTWQHDTGESQYRRGLYTYWCRTFLHPALLAFDAPTREECTVERPRSNTPLQALVLLNDPTYVEAARTLAERMLKEAGKTPAERIAFAYRVVLSRAPNPAEADVLSGLYEHHHKQYRTDAKAAAEALSVGLRPADKSLNAAELAAWTSVARVVLNLHETITRH